MKNVSIFHILNETTESFVARTKGSASKPREIFKWFDKKQPDILLKPKRKMLCVWLICWHCSEQTLERLQEVK